MRVRMRPLILGLTATVCLAACSAASPAPVPDSYVIPGDRAFPTGLAYDPETGHYFVGSAADGALYRGHVDRPDAQLWSPDGTDGRTATSGMTMDTDGRLYVNGGGTNVTRVYDPATENLLAELQGLPGGFVNEISIAEDGTGYVTDSYLPVIYRITENAGGWRMEPWLEVAETAVDWVDGQHNLNGILAIGRHLLSVQSNTGRLWRIDRFTREVTEVDLGGELLPSGDALISDDGRRVYLTQGNLYAEGDHEPRLAALELSADLASARVVDSFVPPGGLLHPSQAASLGNGRVLVVNSQYNRLVAGLGPQSLPFTISSLPVSGDE